MGRGRGPLPPGERLAVSQFAVGQVVAQAVREVVAGVRTVLFPVHPRQVLRCLGPAESAAAATAPPSLPAALAPPPPPPTAAASVGSLGGAAAAASASAGGAAPGGSAGGAADK